jgi:hypothetical protein
VKWSCVVPTCRPERFVQFLEAWGELFAKHEVSLLVIQDTDEPWDFDHDGYEVSAFHRGVIPEFIPQGTDMIRSWGIYQAWVGGSKYTLTLDDDVLPDKDLFQSYERVFSEGAVLSSYLSVGSLTTSTKQMRGFPYRDRVKRPVAVQYGGWDGVLDYDAPTQLAGVPRHEYFLRLVVPVPKGTPVTGCIMNCAWRTEYAPIMWQLPMLNGKFNRFGDIWAGLFAKKTLDSVGAAMVINGEATVKHDRASDPWANLERETPGIPLNEEIWGNLWAKPGDDLVSAYRLVTDSAADFFAWRDPDYAEHFLGARDEWLKLYE